MSLVLQSSGGGSVTINEPTTASNFTQTLPAATGDVALLQTPAFATTIGVGGATPAASGAGITFPATQSASSNANTLDDYEEGTFTATVNYDGGSFTAESAQYTKIGRNVTILINVSYNSGAGTGNTLRTITGLPFLNSGSTQAVFNGLLYNMTTIGGSNTVSFPGFSIPPSNSYIDLYVSQWTGNETYLRFASSIGYFRLSTTYQV